MPKIFQEGLVDPSKKPRIGRPENAAKQEAFVKVAEYLKANDEEQTTISDLIDKMGEFLQGTDLEPYGFTYMKTSLQKHFGGGIIIVELSGYKNIVTLKGTAASVLKDFMRSQSLLTQKQKKWG